LYDIICRTNLNVCIPPEGALMRIDIRQAAERMLRQYALEAEKECEARISYNEMKGDQFSADGWRQTKAAILQLRSLK